MDHEWRDQIQRIDEPEEPMHQTLESVRAEVGELAGTMPSLEDHSPMPAGVPLGAGSSVPLDPRQIWWRKVSELCQDSYWRDAIALECGLPTCAACYTNPATPRNFNSTVTMASELLDPVRDAATEWYDREEAAKEAAATLANLPVVEILDDDE